MWLLNHSTVFLRCVIFSWHWWCETLGSSSKDLFWDKFAWPVRTGWLSSHFRTEVILSAKCHINKFHGTSRWKPKNFGIFLQYKAIVFPARCWIQRSFQWIILIYFYWSGNSLRFTTERSCSTINSSCQAHHKTWRSFDLRRYKNTSRDTSLSTLSARSDFVLCVAKSELLYIE